MSDPRLSLAAAARRFHQLGWMLGTVGNLSAKVDDHSFWITASGKSKGKLTEEDFVRVDLTGKVRELPNPDNRPSAETSIHQVIYRLFPQAQACYHVHSVEANLVCRFAHLDKLSLPPLEMLKGLGIWVENPRVFMPVFTNYLDVPKIAAEIESRFSTFPPEIPALLISDHGVTVWGESLETTENYLEIVEYIFRYLVLRGI
ncbi:aldolase/epimerase [Microcystis aeruginosa NIES-3806]|uniref:Methylthioribulose-1-phosphate dehydratase n=1 Tax=Microcystis aeruginosa NIES-3807 TaxID=2517785 RepID=A0AAD3GA29_MICAE|nr:methylthioribulose 1-phosphate dehydratase [Microcystis aeruginosa]GCL56569.1 aldolase/epimerase [Microcystis aeruginosa NIES-3806]GCL60381.1 aldolase/epimerase [Microcystis aeruginosa NIES-3807]